MTKHDPESKPETHHHGDMVTILVDGDQRNVPDQVYKVANLKVLLGIPPEYVLNIVRQNGQFDDLADGQSIHIKGGESFVSQPPQGGSS